MHVSLFESIIKILVQDKQIDLEQLKHNSTVNKFIRAQSVSLGISSVKVIKQERQLHKLCRNYIVGISGQNILISPISYITEFDQSIQFSMKTFHTINKTIKIDLAGFMYHKPYI